jgi:hypothetical protein
MYAASTSFAPAAWADKPEPLDQDFLDYLAACEGKDDNWTVVAGEKQKSEVAEKAPPKAAAGEKPAPTPEVKP